MRKKWIAVVVLCFMACAAFAEEYITCSGYEGGCKKKMICEWDNYRAIWHCYCICGAYKELTQVEMERQLKLEEANKEILGQEKQPKILLEEKVKDERIRHSE